MNIHLIVNSDFGDWDGIDRFDWEAYRDALGLELTTRYPEAAETFVTFEQHETTLYVDEEPSLALQEIMDAVDPTVTRFYTTPQVR